MDEALTARLRQAMPFCAVLGLEGVSEARDRVEARAAWSLERCTVGGVLHGGYLLALADACGGWSASLNLPEDASGTATVASAASFLRAVRAGTVHVVARPLHIGRSTVVVEIDVTDDRERRCLRVTQTQAVLR